MLNVLIPPATGAPLHLAAQGYGASLNEWSFLPSVDPRRQPVAQGSHGRATAWNCRRAPG